MELQLGPGNFDNVMVFQHMRLAADGNAIQQGSLRSFQVSQSVTFLMTRDDRYLYAGLAQRGQGSIQIHFLSGANPA